MGFEKNIKGYWVTLFKTVAFLIVFGFVFCSCRKGVDTAKLSHMTCYVIPPDETLQSYYLCDGEMGLITFNQKSIPIDTTVSYLSHRNFNRVRFSTLNGLFFKSSMFLDSAWPKITTISPTLNQIKPNSNLFSLISNLTYYDSGSIPYPYTKLYLTDKSISWLREFELPDSAVTINTVMPMPDGRFAVSVTKNGKKSLSCYNTNLQMDWTRTVESGNNSEDYFNYGMLTTSSSIYLLQKAIYISSNFRIFQYDLTGRLKSIYNSSKANVHAAGQLVESPNGFYIFGTRYIPEKSDYDICITAMSRDNKQLSEQLLSLTNYFPDWNTSVRNVFLTFFSWSSSNVIKTPGGYVYAFAYPDNKNKYSLGLVLFDNDMKIRSTKVIAKNLYDFPYGSDENLTVLTDENRLYLMWRVNDSIYFYLLDMEGVLVN